MPVPETDRILMMDLTSARAEAKEVTPDTSHNHEVGQHPAFVRASQNMVVVAMLLDMLLAPSADIVDGLYRQLR
jgi:hypothetical protein